MSKDTVCKTDKRAPHGFMRDASHNEGRYVCECEGWEPPNTDYIIIDTETASLQGGICEIAWLRCDEQLNILDQFESRVNPERPIDPGAFKVHGISQEDCEGKPTIAEIARLLPEPIMAIGHNCVTGDHEILTKSGWVRFDSIESCSINAACWSPDGTIEFLDSMVVKNSYNGPMYEYDTQYHKGVYTPDHKVVYTTSNSLTQPVTWKTNTAANYAKLGVNSVLIPSSGLWHSKDELSITPLEARFLEMLRADGNIYSNNVRLKFSKARKIDRCRSLLKDLDIPFSETLVQEVTRINILSCSLRDKAVAILGEGKNKRLGGWVLNLSLEARKALLDESQYWDGFKKRHEEGSKTQIKIHSQHASEAEWFQIAAILSGYTSAISLNKPNNRGFSREDGLLSSVTLRARGYVKTLEKAKLSNYDGQVFCLTTPTGFFVTRRNGAVWITGNCSFDLRVLNPHITAKGYLCTLSLSRQLVKNTTNHKLSTLKTELALSDQLSHSALGDVLTVRDLLLKLLAISNRDLSQLFTIQKSAVLLHKMPFGMYKGSLTMEVPADYRNWLLRQDIDKDVRYTLTYFKKAGI